MAHTDDNRRAELRVAGFVIAVLNILNRQQVEACAEAVEYAEDRPEDTYATDIARRLLRSYRARDYIEESEREGFREQIAHLEATNTTLRSALDARRNWPARELLKLYESIAEHRLPELRELITKLGGDS